MIDVSAGGGERDLAVKPIVPLDSSQASGGNICLHETRIQVIAY